MSVKESCTQNTYKKRILSTSLASFTEMALLTNENRKERHLDLASQGSYILYGINTIDNHA